MTFTRPNAGSGAVNYGFSGSKLVHSLGLAGILLIAGAVYALTGGNPGAPWLIAAAILGLHLGAWLLFGAGITYWVFRTGRYVMRDRQVAKIFWRGDEQVLDIGCGSGVLLVAAAKFLKTGRATGIDTWGKNHGQTFSANLVRANAETENVGERVDAREGDARAMEFADATFDVVLSSFVFHHLGHDGRKAAAAEAVRVMKPGGRLVLLDAQYTGMVAKALREAGAVEVERARVLPLVPGLRWITARKPV